MNIFQLPSHLHGQDSQGKNKHIGKVTEFRNVRVLQLQLLAGTVVPEHNTDADVIISIQKGSAVFDFQGEKVTLTPGQLLHINALELHSVEALEDMEALVVRIQDDAT
jgi:quercetin dioxygenase-like cupin family protein